MHEHAEPTPESRALRFLEILSAARDFGLRRLDIERIARQFDPFVADPGEVADALADALLQAHGARSEEPRLS
jgi:hypothetical protein